MEALRSNAQRAKNAVLFIYIVMVMDVINLISEYMQYDLLQASANGIYITEEEALSNDVREGILGIVYLAVFITSGVLFICWFRRAYYNLHLRTAYLKHTEGWAAGAWFTPIISLFRPYEIMKELYRETNRILAEKNPDYTEKQNGTVMAWWWALWIISSFVGNFVLRTSINTESIEGLITNAIADMILSLMGIPLALLAAKLVKDYSGLEAALAELKDQSVETEKPNSIEPPISPIMQ